MSDPLTQVHAEVAQLVRVAGQIGLYLAQARSRALDEERRGDVLRERALSEQLRSEVRMGQEFYQSVERQAWWERAEGRDVANAYGFAKRFSPVDPRAVAAAATIEQEVYDRWGVDLRADEPVDFASLDANSVLAPVLATDSPTPEGLQGVVDEALRAVEREQEVRLVAAKGVEVKEVAEARAALTSDDMSLSQVDTEVAEAALASNHSDTLAARRSWAHQQTLAGLDQEAVRAVVAASKMRSTPLSSSILVTAGTQKKRESSFFKQAGTAMRQTTGRMR